ncbi:MAG: ABC transporter ATP-binding protein/permease, partial [Prevotellaceae bacterium]|nr:ABC transporter ATP-binding protein/permease [Prevotellaceae bacterium]
MKTFLRILAFAKPYHYYWPKYLFTSILGLIFGILNFVLVIPLIDVIFDKNAISTIAACPEFSFSVTYFKDLFSYFIQVFVANYGVMGAVGFVCLSLLVASFLSNFMKYYTQRILVSMRTMVMQRIRTALYQKITRMDVGFFTTQRKGNILSSISNDVTEVQNGIGSSFHIILRDPLVFIGNLCVLFYMSVELTTITLIALPISFYFIGKIVVKLRRSSSKAQSLMGEIVSYFEETISGIRIIKAFNAQRYVCKRLEETNTAHRTISKKMFNRLELASPLSEFLGITVAMGVFFYGGWMLETGRLDMTIGAFMGYWIFYYQLLMPARSIANAYANIQRGLASGERIFEILDTPITIRKNDHPVSVTSFNDSIEYRNVSFRYDSEEVLKNINLHIPKGAMVALVGPSGAGKTTMADLIPRFYDVSPGEILLDGINIKNYHPKDLISLMGIVTQEPILFNDSVYSNIVLGAENVTEEDVIQAAKTANAHEFIVQMENGYQTNIGDQGNRLSGGQRQRLSIARAILKNPAILILDEATSALDTESERLVQDALTKLMKNRTSIVIAHRLSTIQHADKIVVL